MSGQLFIYTRLENFDYRLIYAPSESFLPEPYRSSFIDFAREVINEDNSLNGSIDGVRWSYIRKGHLSLIGIGCHNNLLKELHSQKESRIIRGFFGVVVNDMNESLITELTSMEFYKDLFCHYVEPLWSLSKKSEGKVNSNIQEIEIKAYPYDGQSLKLNTDAHKCTILSCESQIEGLLCGAIRSCDVDFVTNLNTYKHVTMSQLYSFHNITVIGNFDSSNFDIVAHSKEIKEEKAEKIKNVHYLNEETIESRMDILVDNDSAYYEKLARRIIERARRCGINVELLINSLTACFHRTSTSSSNSESTDDVVSYSTKRPERPVVDEAEVERDLTAYTEKKTERRDRLFGLKQQYKSSHKEENLELVTDTVEEIGDIIESPEEISSLASNNAIELSEM